MRTTGRFACALSAVAPLAAACASTSRSQIRDQVVARRGTNLKSESAKTVILQEAGPATGTCGMLTVTGTSVGRNMIIAGILRYHNRDIQVSRC